MTGLTRNKQPITSWIARTAVLFVFIGNMLCVVNFLASPEHYALAFQLSGVPGRAAIQGMAVAFLMWNVTYPLVIVNPVKYQTLFIVVLVQQVVGLIGESIVYAQIGAGYEQLAASLLRFISFDALGLIVMAIAFIALRISLRRAAKNC